MGEKLCECGCGFPTPLAKRNQTRGDRKGQPLRFIHGHNLGRGLNQTDFIARAQDVHNHRYEYGEVLFTGWFDKVRIVCPEHGVFLQAPANHLRGGGCRKCFYTRLHASNRGKAYRITHGQSLSPTYKSWSNMRRRCLDANRDHYDVYGGAGVKVAPEWMTFEVFLKSMGERPAGTTLGRILDRGGYSEDNCFWMTQAEQNLAKRNNYALLKFAAKAA
jgi:hypothetical protein